MKLTKQLLTIVLTLVSTLVLTSVFIIYLQFYTKIFKMSKTSKFAEKRKNLFERTSPVTPLPSPLSENSFNKNINWIQNLVKTSNQCYSDFNNQTFCENTVQLKYEKCCHLDHISSFTEEEKN
jgi:hypothetical protein